MEKKNVLKTIIYFIFVLFISKSANFCAAWERATFFNLTIPMLLFGIGGVRGISNIFSDDDKTINPLTILTAPLWFPVAMLTCLGDKDSSTGFGALFDPCPFR